jgi:FecR protein
MSTKRPPVEPLSRPAWDRVEAGVFARLDRGDHLLASVHGAQTVLHSRRWLMAGALAAAASVALWLGSDPNDQIAPLAQQVEPATPVTPLVARHEARIVSTEAPTETTLGEAVLTLAAHSDVNVAGSDAEGWLVRLDAGQVDCKVAPRHGRPPFVVQGGLTKVTVVGTRFRVQRTGAEARVSVTEGHVQVDSGDAHVLLAPGEAWPSAEPGDSLGSEPVAPAEVNTPGEPNVQRRSKPAYVVAPRAQRRFERAARLESKDPAAALAIYQQLAHGNGPWAANALYAQARLELERGRPERAEPLLLRYLNRYPQGLNAADVRKQLERIQK